MGGFKNDPQCNTTGTGKVVLTEASMEDTGGSGRPGQWNVIQSFHHFPMKSFLTAR